MAQKVNVKFVVILSGVLVALFVGVAATALLVIRKSGDDYIRLGDARAAKGDWKGAQELYSKAVFKEQGNVEYLTKWRDAVQQWVPPTQTELETAYGQNLMGAIRALAVAQRTNVQAHHDHLGLRHLGLKQSPFSRQGYSALVAEVESTLKNFDDTSEDKTWPSIRKYRGLAVVRELREGIEVVPEQLALAKEDLEATLKATPGDSEAATGLMEWHVVQAERARMRGLDIDADALYQAGLKVASDFASANPDSPQGWVMSFASKLDATRVAEIGRGGGSDAVTRVRQRLDELRPEFDTLVSKLAGVDGSKIDADLVTRFARVDELINNRGVDYKPTEALVSAALAKQPSNADLLAFMAEIRSRRGDFEGAIADLEKIVTLPPLPVSYEALRLVGRRTEAVLQQATFALRMYDVAQAEEARKAAIEKAKGFREALAKLIPSDSPALQKIDGRLALAQGDQGTAFKLLTQYNQSTQETDAEAMWLVARMSSQLNQLGEARRLLNRVVEREPGNIGALLTLGDVELRLENAGRAEMIFKTVLELAPGNKVAEERLALLGQMLRGEGQASDPIAAALISADRLASGEGGAERDMEKAEQVLRDALAANPGDPRLVQGLMRLLQAGKNDREGAMKVLEDAIAAKPEDQSLRAMKIAMTVEDPVERQLQVIDLSPGLSDDEKKIQKAGVLRGAGRNDEARALVTELAGKLPDEPRVLELRFIDALEQKDLASARQLADLAANKDADKANGLTFRARLQLAEENETGAIATLEEASKLGTVNAETWMLLGRLQLRNQRGNDAINSFTRALELRPNDMPMIRERIGALVQLGRGQEALAAAREAERFGKNDPEFVQAMLALKQAFGDERTKADALREREALAVSRPEDTDNQLALAALLMDAARYADARKIIDAVKAKRSDLQVTAMDARWHADQNDITKAGEAWNEFLGKLTDATATAEPYLAFGAFMMERNQFELAMQGFERARRFQDPKIAEGDRAVGDAYSRQGKFQQAADAYKRVVDAGADTPEQLYRKRLIESALRAQNFALAEEQLAAFGPKAENDVILQLLRADILRNKDDTRGSKAVLDQLVQRFPREPMVYVRRAQLMAETPGNDSDVMADLDAALRVDANYWQALAMRSNLLASQDRIDEAVRDVRTALSANPGLDDLRVGVTRELIRRGRESEAAEISESAVALRPGDANLLVSIGDLFMAGRMAERAIDYYKRAYRVSSVTSVTQRYLDALLDATPPKLAEAEGVIRELGDEKITADANLLIVRAELLAKRNRMADAQKDLTTAVKLLPRGNANAVVFWFLRSRGIMPNRDEHLKYLQTLQGSGEIGDWFAFLRTSLTVEKGDNPSREQAVKELTEIIGQTASEPVLLLSHRLRTSTLYALDKFEEAAAAGKAGLERFPDDWELNNNYAFTVGKHLNRPADAVPFAQKATEVAPGNPDVWDTLGLLQMRSGQLRQAEQSLGRALALASGGPTRIPVLLHLTELLVEKKDKEGAVRRLDELRTATADFPDLAKAYQEEIDAIRSRVESM